MTSLDRQLALGILCLLYPRQATCLLSLCGDSKDLNSGSHTFMVSALTTKQFHQTSNSKLLSMTVHVHLLVCQNLYMNVYVHTCLCITEECNSRIILVSGLIIDNYKGCQWQILCPYTRLLQTWMKVQSQITFCLNGP